VPAQPSFAVLHDGDCDHLVGHVAVYHDPVPDMDAVR
jgi:hypothetical protein